MKSRQKSVPSTLATLPPSYLALLAEYPLLPIRTAREYDRAAEIVHRLALREDELEAGQEAYLKVLEALVERFEQAHHSMDADGVSPTQVLRSLVEQAGVSVTELGKLLGSKGAASKLLSGKRNEPSKAQIARLCSRFKVDTSLFLLPSDARASAA